jgi:GH18 family chitinase
MIELTKPYLTRKDEYVFSIEGLFLTTASGDMTYKPSEKVFITFENDALVEVFFENIKESDVDYELWWELQGTVADNIKELKNG